MAKAAEDGCSGAQFRPFIPRTVDEMGTNAVAGQILIQLTNQWMLLLTKQ